MTISPDMQKKFSSLVNKMLTEEQQRVSRYGRILPPIATQFHGQQIVAVGNRLYSSDKWKSFPGFLLDYHAMTFGEEWGKCELAKPEAQWHPLMQWRVQGLRKAKTLKGEGKQGASANNALFSFFAFVYDLYVVDNNSRLDEVLLHRLKNSEQFQGARHEVFAEATCLRAGFIIQRENERDGSTRHAEFTATDRVTGQSVSVEAKSKHRPGVLGYSGAAQPVGN